MNSQLTRYAFLAGATYFVFMAIAHFFSIKVPVLFVYYDTPFYAYQDKIISFAVLAYVALFYCAANSREVAKPAIIVIGMTALGLSLVNISEALNSLLTSQQTTLPYWLQTAAIAGYFITLLSLYIKDGKQNQQ